MSELEDVIVDIAGAPVEFTILKRDAAWIAQGTWRDHAVQLEADHIAPDRLQLQTARACATHEPRERQARLRLEQKTRDATQP